MKISKYAFGIFNCVVILLSVLLIIIGTILIVTHPEDLCCGLYKSIKDWNDMFSFVGIENTFNIFGGACIGCGLLSFLISLIGLTGAMKDSRYILGTYMIVMGGLILAELIAVTYICIKGLEHVNTAAIEEFQEKYDPAAAAKNSFTELANEYMKEKTCCVLKNWKDLGKNLTGDGIPDACCNKMESNQTQEACLQFKDETSKRETCIEKLYREISIALYAITGSVGLLEIGAMILSIFVFRAAYYDYM